MSRHLQMLGLGLAAAVWLGANTLPVTPLAERGQPASRTFLPRDYRGHDQIWRILETREGLMLFGSRDCVLEFDGLTWRTIPVPGGSFIRAMALDAGGTVWVAGVNELGRLVKNKAGRLEYESLRAKVPAWTGELGALWCVHAMPDGIYFQGNNAVLRWDGATFEVWPMDDKGVVLSYRLGDSLLVSRSKGWFSPKRGSEWEEIAPLAVLPRFLWQLPGGRTVVGTGTKGLMELKGKELVPLATEIDEWLKTKKPYSGMDLPGGRLLITSLQGGALILGPDLKLEAHFDESASLPAETVISSLLDRNGVLWLGTDNGICRLDYGSPVRIFSTAHGLGRSGPESMDWAEGRLRVSTARNVLELAPPDKLPGNPRFKETQLQEDRIMQMTRFPDGIMVCGLEGLTWISNGQSTKLDAPKEVRGLREVVALRGQPGRYVATFINGLASWRRDGETWTFEGIWPEPRGEVRALVQDADGALWTSTLNSGVLRIEPAQGEPKAARIDRLAEESGLPIDRKIVWLDTVGGAPLFKTQLGFFRWDAATRKFRPEASFGARFADGSTTVRLSAGDDRGGQWMAVEPRDGRPHELVYGRDGKWEQLPMPDLDRLGTFNFLNLEKRDGREILWFGGQSELWRIDVTAWRAQPPAPPARTLLRGILAGRDRQLGEDEGGVRLPAKENTLRFAFATPGLAGEPRVLHESCLRGFADGDIQIGPVGERTFTNLPPGSYVFEARGRSADGRWSEPAKFAFTVLAPWWQTPWAIVAWVALVGLVVFAYIRWRIRGLRRERTRLEAVVAERTAELAQKNIELERLHRVDQDEKLSARLAEEKAQLELLRYQLNPHFLYNSLNSIRALVYSNAEAAGEMVTRLSEFCRATLTRRSDDVTTVGEEAEMLQAYLDIERTRWQSGLMARIEIDPAARGEPLPQFLLLPLLENAIKYGGKTSPALLEVVVSARVEDDELVCEVANTGEWVELNGETPRESTRIGLENLRRRIARHYGLGRDVHVAKGGGWVRVTLRLPRVARAAETESAAG